MAEKTIALLGLPVQMEDFQATAAITPGELLDFSAGKWIAHAGAGLNAVPTFALERDELGNGITVDYAADDYVKSGTFHTGQHVLGFIASGQDLSIGDYVESDGSGGLRALGTDAATDDTQRESVVARALEASGAVVARTRIRFEIV